MLDTDINAVLNMLHDSADSNPEKTTPYPLTHPDAVEPP
jgi:hypothetical protein